MLRIDLSFYLWTMAYGNTHTWLKKRTQQQQRQQQQSAAHNTKRERLSIVFFTTHFSSFLPVLLSPRKERWKNRCCCGICERSWVCPRSAKNKTFFFSVFFSARSSHFSPFFYQFFRGCPCVVFCARWRYPSPVPDNKVRMTSHVTLSAFSLRIFCFLFSFFPNV